MTVRHRIGDGMHSKPFNREELETHTVVRTGNRPGHPIAPRRGDKLALPSSAFASSLVLSFEPPFGSRHLPMWHQYFGTRRPFRSGTNERERGQREERKREETLTPSFNSEGPKPTSA